MENNDFIKENEELNASENTADTTIQVADDSIERNVRLMSPGRMVLRRFFRSKLSIIGLVMIVGLFLFCWVGPLFYNEWQYTSTEITYTDENGVEHSFSQVVETEKRLNALAKPSKSHPLGTDKNGRDVLARIMEGGKISLAISFLSVFIITLLGVVFGGLAGYFGGAIDTVIMRICDILMCLPGFPILLIVGTLIESVGIDLQFRIYYLMAFLTIISWSGTARHVR